MDHGGGGNVCVMLWYGQREGYRDNGSPARQSDPAQGVLEHSRSGTALIKKALGNNIAWDDLVCDSLGQDGIKQDSL